MSAQAQPVPTIDIMGVDVGMLTGEQALELIRHQAERSGQMLSYVNAHTLNLAARDPDLHEALKQSRLVLNDGIGLELAARMHGGSFPENLNGSDFTLRLLELAATEGWSVFLLGAEPGIAEAAAEQLSERIEDLQVVGTCHGFTGESDEMLAARVRESEADLLIVAFGSPLQETWLARNLHETGASIGIGVGAFLDFTAGKVSRAPRWMNRLGVEWCYRLFQEPGRMWRRYLLGNPAFLVRAWRDRRRKSSRMPWGPSRSPLP